MKFRKVNKISKNKFNTLKQYAIRKIADKDGVFLVEGRKGVEEVLASEFEVVGVYLLAKYFHDERYYNIIDLAEEREVELASLGEIEANKLSQLITGPGILAVVKRKEEVKSMEGKILVLDQISDPGNLGTIIRTAIWFGVRNIVLSEGSVSQYNSKAIRSSMGAFFYVNIWEDVYLPKFFDAYKKDGYKILAADAHRSDMDLHELPSLYNDDIIYLFGNESHGLSEGLDRYVDNYYTIDKIGEGESLNLAVSVGIVLGFSFLA